MPMLPGSNNVSGPPAEGAMDLVATHQRLLIGACLRTTGPILELGVGWYSTPLLHEVAEAQDRFVCTVDNNEHWLAQFKGLESLKHSFRLIGWWGDLLDVLKIESERWSVCFLDQGQPIEREYAARALKDRVDVFVMHDTEEGFAYGYDRLLGLRRYGKENRFQQTYGMFRHQYTDRCQKVWTTVASNAIDVSAWFKDLPPVEPSEEVT